MLEAMLALEQGAPDEARPLLAEARRLCDRVPFAGGPVAGAYLSMMPPK